MLKAAPQSCTKTTCPYCGVGCGVEIGKSLFNDEIAVRGDASHPANFGALCSKGSALGETIGVDRRLLEPHINGAPATWDAALDKVAKGFAQTIAEHGPNSVALYVSGQCLTEDYYVANKFMKGYVGSANIDTNSRLCMASSVAGHKRAFGADTVPGTYEDLTKTDLLVLIGSNLAWCHPVLFQRILKEKAERQAKGAPPLTIITLDPRATATSSQSDQHLALKSGSDVALFQGLYRFLQTGGFAVDAYVKAHTTGALEAGLAAKWATLPEVAKHTGLSVADLTAFYTGFANNKKVVSVYSQGVNQSSTGTDKVAAIINCHLLTGRIGKAGMGPFSITGQPNAMGGREVGGLANQLACHMEIANPDHRALVQRFWGSPTIASHEGKKAVDLFNAIEDGSIKAVWIMATNPVVSMPDANRARAALLKCPLVVVSEIEAITDTAACADVLLPATGWGEKTGTVTNSERRISRQRSFLPAPAQARHDWWAICQVAQRMGFAGFDYENPAAIFREYAALSGFENIETENAGIGLRRDFDISAYAKISDEDYDSLKPFQWPAKKGHPEGGRFFAKGNFFTPDRKARILPLSPKAPVLSPTHDYPLILNSGRVRDHWHTSSRTGRAPTLSSHLAEPFVEIHPFDAKNLDIFEADLVELNSPHGACVVRALITERVAQGTLFMPIHWTDQNASAARVSSLIAPHTDAISGQPELKHAPVSARLYKAKCYGFAVLRARPQNPDFSYWALASAKGGYRLEFASKKAGFDLCTMEDMVRPMFESGLSIDNAEVSLASYADPATGVVRVAGFNGSVFLGAAFVAPRPVNVPRSWAAGLLSAADLSAVEVLAAKPRGDVPDVGAIICACYQVGENQIKQAVSSGKALSVEAVGDCLKAGTNCGSCKIDIARIIKHALISEPA